MLRQRPNLAPGGVLADKNRNLLMDFGFADWGISSSSPLRIFLEDFFVDLGCLQNSAVLATVCPEKQNETNLKKFSFLCYY